MPPANVLAQGEGENSSQSFIMMIDSMLNESFFVPFPASTLKTSHDDQTFYASIGGSQFSGKGCTLDLKYSLGDYLLCDVRSSRVLACGPVLPTPIAGIAALKPNLHATVQATANTSL